MKYGQSYRGYPTHLRGYYKYTPGKINYYGDKTPSDGLKKDDQDQCLIYIALSSKQHEVISKTGQVVPYPFDDESVFAYGSYVSGTTEDKTGDKTEETILQGYAPFKVKLKYKTAIPKTESFYILMLRHPVAMENILPAQPAV